MLWLAVTGFANTGSALVTPKMRPATSVLLPCHPVLRLGVALRRGIVSRAARRAVIAEGLKRLKMPSVLRDYEQRARQAQDAPWDYEDYLWQLL